MDGDEFQSSLELLNVVTGPEFRATQAQIEHTDEFADLILPGETYYRRDAPNSFMPQVKLSRRSMERVLNAVVSCNLRLISMAEPLVAEQKRELQRACSRVSAKE